MIGPYRKEESAMAKAQVSKIEKMITVEAAIKNPRLLRGLKKECFTCDPYNPCCKPRLGCPECGGAGTSPVEFVGIISELKKSRHELQKRTAAYFDEEE